MLEGLGLPVLLAIFAGSAAAVWFAGSKLAGLVDAVAGRTGIGQAFAGMLLLGGITSLPELAAVGTSAALGNAGIAVNNLLGTASINLVLLAVADFAYGRDALTRAAARPGLLMQGVLSMLLAVLVALAVVAVDVPLGPIGAGSLAIGIGAIAAVKIASAYEGRSARTLTDPASDGDEDAGEDDPRGTGRLVALTAGAALVILGAGFLLSISADAIATERGLASGMVGFLLVGFATSLPELSSVLAAVRRRRYQLAIGDIFGTNLFNLLLIPVADLIYAGGPVLAETGRFEVIGATLAALLTGIYVVGLLERRDRTILRIGYDSLLALIVFATGVALLARL